MRLNVKSVIRAHVAALVLVVTGFLPLAASESEIPDAARAEMEAGRAAIRADDWAGAVERYRKAAELAPRNLEVQQAFILYHRAGTLRTLSREDARKRFETLREDYRRKASREPKDPMWQVLLGAVQFYEDPHASQRAYERAVDLAPDSVDALQMLGVIATTRGENDLARSYYERAAAADPGDPRAAGMLVGVIRDEGYEAFRDAALELIERFPESSEAVKWYYWLGVDAKSPIEKRRAWSEAIDRYPVDAVGEEQIGWLSSIYRATFQTLQADDPLEAERFARETLDQFQGRDAARQWFTTYRAQSDFNLALAAAEVGDHDAALDVLLKLRETVGARDPLREMVSYRTGLARAAKGEREEALELFLDVLREGPRPVFEATYYRVAEEAGLSEAEAESRLWDARLAEAKVFEDFSLEDPAGEVVRLSDLRGQIVLVNFWYPSCGPCRGEFPHLQNLVRRFRDRGFTVLALNTHPQEADKVAPFLANNRYEFRALQTPGEEWSKDRYGVIGTPANFLLDRDGRIVAQPRLHDDETEQRLSLLIEALLERGG